MTFKIVEATTDADLEALVRCEFDSYENPVCNLKQLFFPAENSSPEAREAAIQSAIKRQTHWHRSDPTSVWLKVVDDTSGAVVGGACWHVYDTDPYSTESDEECDWWAAGEDRDIANGLMAQFLTPRMTWMTKPHVFLDICFTHPDYRRRGVGNLLMDWGVKQADQKGYDTYIDATDIGRGLYSHWDFVEGPVKEFTMKDFPATSRRDELEKELLPFEWWPMYRGARVDGKPKGEEVLPWNK